MNGPRRLLVCALTALSLAGAGSTLAAPPSADAPEVGASAKSPPSTAEATKTADSAKSAEAATAETAKPAAPLNDEPLAEDYSLAEEQAAIAQEDESLLWTLIRTFAVLGFVIACIYLVLNFGLRRMMGLKPGSQTAQSLVTVVDRVVLDPKHSLVVLKAAGEYLLVGSGEGGMNLIAKLQTEEVERLQRERAVATGNLSPFLQKLLSRGGHPPPSA